jgi:CheY-like chemotaxis protein
MAATILLFEKNDAIRKSLGDWLELVLPHQEIVQARDRAEAVHLAEDHHPCAVLLDIDPLGIDGIDAIRRLRDAAPSSEIVVLAMDDYKVLYRAALAAGADACVRTWQIDEELLPVLREILELDDEEPETKTVLCIEDDLDMLKLIKLTLERGPFRVLAAVSGRQGLDIARAVRPDVVLLDLMMPEMDGWEVHRRLKEQKELQDVPVVAVSVIQPNGAKSRDLDVDDYVTKPFRPDDLLRRVRNAARVLA